MIDSSAVLAILLDEPERPALIRKLAADPVRLMSVANWLEAGIVIDDRLGEEGARDLKLLVLEAGIRLVPVARSRPRSPARPIAASAAATIRLD